MKTLKRTAFFLLIGLFVVVATEVGEQAEVPGIQSPISGAEARVGRPLTPVSVAGVARRTVRRCAVGVYNC